MSHASLFYTVFYSLEDEGILDISNEVDMFCIHLVFLIVH